jgi:CubicO group peptidase (beta-lactamase class C family)
MILGTLLALSPALVASGQGFPLQQAQQDRIDAYIRSSMQRANIPGLALGVVRGDEVVYVQGYGIAAPDGRVVTAQTPFILGSTSKSFTALAAMQLVEVGMIDLDAPVTTYLPWFHTDNAAASAQITVRNLLHQTSGLPAGAGRMDFAENDQSSTALETGIRALSAMSLSRPAGQRYEYANGNYNALGLIVQAVSGLSYEDYIRLEVFAPLQMTHSAAALSDPAARDLATGYRYWFSWPMAFDAPYPRRMTPSGFLISSAEDMTHYLIAQLNGGAYGSNQLLSPEGITTLHLPGARISPSRAYGMGWMIENQPGSTEVWHNGDVSNFHSNLLLLPDQNIGIVVLVNVGGFLNSSALDIPVRGVAEILLGNSLSEVMDPALAVVPQLCMLAAALVLLISIAASWRSIRRWPQRGQLAPVGIDGFTRLYLPLVADVLPVILAWILLLSQPDTPIEAIALFAPDVCFVLVVLTVLSVGWAMVRIRLTLRSHALIQHTGS